MGRPSENLGEAFSCRLQVQYDELARAERENDGTPLSEVVRSWIESYFSLRGEGASSWKKKYFKTHRALKRARAQLIANGGMPSADINEAANG